MKASSLSGFFYLPSNLFILGLIISVTAISATANQTITSRGTEIVAPCEATIYSKRGKHLDAPADIVTVSLGNSSKCNAVNVYGVTLATEVFIPIASSEYNEDFSYRVIIYIKPETPIRLSIKGWDGWDSPGPITRVDVNLEPLP